MHFVYSELCLFRLPVSLLGCEFVGLPVSVLVNHGRPEIRSFQTRMRLDYPERESTIPDTICESDKHYTKAQYFAHCHCRLSKAPDGPSPIDC